MNRFLPNFKSQILQVMRAPKDKRLLKHFYDSLDRFKSIEETDFWESFYELTHSRKWNFPQICDEYVLGNFFPRQCSEIGDKMEILFSRNIQYEIRWWIACFQLCAKQLNFFIESRRQYDTYILLGEYEKALQTLNSLEQQIGVSFWFYESKIFVYSRLGMDVKDLVQKLPSNSNTSIINFYVMKNLDTVTYTEYTKILENALKSNDDADFVTYIKYRLLPMEYEMESKDYLPIMMCANDCPLVDRYLIFLDIFENILLQDLSQYKFILSRYTVHLEGVNDERLQAMCFCVGSLQDRLKYKAKHKLLKAKEYLIAGDIGKCQDIAVEYLEKCPYCLQAINIVAESEIKLQNRCVQFEGTILREILDSIEFVYIMQEGWKQKLFALKKLFNCCNMSVWAQELNASVTNSYTSLENEYYLIRRKKMCLQFLDIETICECLSREDALEYLSQWFTENKYIRFRYVLLERDYGQADGLVENIDIKCIIGIRDANKDYNEKKMHLNMVIDSGNTFWIRASKYYLSSLDEKTQFMEVMQFAVSLLTENMDKALFIPWRVYIDIIENSDGEIRSNICVPILYFIQYKYSGMETKDDLSLMCEDFLYFQGKEQPSLLNVHSDLYPKKALVFFLRYICVPDILSTALASVIKNSMDLWKERIDICQILCNIDAANERIYEEEIRILTQKRKIYSELKIIEENRIHVNTEEMRPRLMEELEGDFVRYKLYLDKRWLELLETVTQKKSQSVVVLSREPERVLKELIEKIRDAFVSSTEYGLDLTLSLSIRHGAIGDVLRRPLANAELNTIYNEKEEAYEWNHKLPREMTKEEREVIKSAIIRLNEETEAIIEDLKSKYIQISTESGHNEGIFNYCITSYEFDQLIYNVENIGDLSEFIDYIFEYLWKKTENNLLLMKRLLRNDILSRYLDAFNAVKSTIDGLGQREKVKSLRRKIVDTSNEMQNVIENICFWFQRSTESKNQDFDLDFVFQMGYETICNMHPETRFGKIELNRFRTDGKKIEGKYMKAYSDIFYNLFDNIYKKATDKNGMKQIEYSLIQENNKQNIYLQNDFDCSGDISGDLKKLMDLERILSSDEYLDHVKGEGGTGIPKICKIIRKDLRKNGIIKFGLKEQENKFFIEIEI